MLSGTVLSEATSVHLAYLIIAVLLVMASLGCGERRDVVPNEPQLMPAGRYQSSEITSAHRVPDSPVQRVSESGITHQDQARAWLAERYRHADAATMAHEYEPSRLAGDRAIGGIYGDYEVMEESDAFQRRLYPTLRF